MGFSTYRVDEVDVRDFEVEVDRTVEIYREG